MSGLSREAASRVADSLKTPHPTHPYTYLKRHLISAYSVSQFSKDMRVVKMKIGPGKRPSQILDKMLATLPAGEDQSNPPSLFRSIFFEKLPSDIRDHIMMLRYDRFRDVAITADEL